MFELYMELSQSKVAHTSHNPSSMVGSNSAKSLYQLWIIMNWKTSVLFIVVLVDSTRFHK